MKNAEEGDDNIRATLTGPNEIHIMARAFNTMMSALERRRNDLEQQKQTLIHEINEREIIEQALTDSENRLKSIFDNVVDGILTLDENKVIESCNPASEILLSPASLLIGKSINTVLKQYQSPLLIDDVDFNNKPATPKHIVIVNHHGVTMDLNLKISQMRIKGVNKYIIILLDITDSQSQQKRISSLLAQNEVIISTIPGLIYELNSEGNLIWWNKRVEEITGYSADKLTLKNALDFFPDDDKKYVKNAINTAFNQGSSELHAGLITADGVIPYQFISVTAHKFDNQKPTILGVGMDDSQSVTIQDALQKARDAAVESAKIKSEFLANMSHEIRTPMNGMVGMLQLLADSQLSKEQQTYADIAIRSSDQLLNIINDILDLSKMEAGKLSLDHVEFSPRIIIEDVLDLFSQRAHEKGLEIYSQIAIDVPNLINGDPTRFHQIISNLVGNAVKFTDQGHILVTCNSSTLRHENKNMTHLYIDVTDTGIGVSDSDKEKIFDSFVQADGSLTRKHSGTGLGLAIVHQLIEMMGGHIALESTENKGSVFHIEISFSLSEESIIGELSSNLDEQAAHYIGNDNIQFNILNDYLSRFNCKLSMSSKADFENTLNKLDHNIIFIDKCDIKFIEKCFYGKSQLPSIIVLCSKHEKHYDSEVIPIQCIDKPIRFSLFEPLFSRLSMPFYNPEDTNNQSPVINTKSEDRILIVEDNATNQNVIQSMLNRIGFETITTVNNGLEAIEATKENTFDIILMDCQMPIMDGYQATHDIRLQQTSESRPTIIAMTGNAMEGDREKCIKSGMDDYMAKPIRFTELKKIMSSWTKTVLH